MALRVADRPGKPGRIGRAWLPALICLVIAFLLAEANAQQERTDSRPPPDLFDHEQHEGLKVDCNTCHVRKGKPELRKEACFVCHDGEDPVGLRTVLVL